MILMGEMKPGEKILQEKIAALLGVSRMPLHKAFQMLEDEFLVESIPRRGIYVRRPDLKEILEAFECREGLEGVAARRAAQYISEDQINELYDLMNPFRFRKDIDEIEYRNADRAFHEIIINSSGNSILQKLNNIGNILTRTYPKGIILPYEESIQDHLKIIRSFRERSALKAEQLIREHSRKARNIIEKQILSKKAEKENEQTL